MRNIRLESAISEKGYNQTEFALKIKKTKGTVSNWITGYSNPDLKTAIKVAHILNKDVSYLFGQEVQESCTNKDVI